MMYVKNPPHYKEYQMQNEYLGSLIGLKDLSGLQTNLWQFELYQLLPNTTSAVSYERANFFL